MQNVFAIETKVAHRRGEWERAIAAATQASQTRPGNGLKYWSPLAQRVLARLRARATPRELLPAWNPAGVTCATALEGGRATAM